MIKANNIVEKINFIEDKLGHSVLADIESMNQQDQQSDGNQPTMSIKILSVLGGLLATLTFIGFLGLSGLLNNPSGALIIGAILLIVAIIINKKYNAIILDTISVSALVSGLALLSFGFTLLQIDKNIIIVFIALVAVLILFIIQNYITAFLSTLALSSCILALIFFNNITNWFHGYIFITTIIFFLWIIMEAKIITSHIKLSKLYTPIRSGLLISVLIGYYILIKQHIVLDSLLYPWLPSIVLLPLTLYTVFRILQRLQISSLGHKIIIYTICLLILFATIQAPSIPATIFIILLSHLVNYKTGIAMGLISLLYFTGQFYYDLSYTLLTKSAILFLSGFLFLGLYFFIDKISIKNEKI